MADVTQYIDNLITFINNAEDPGTVTNQILAAVLDYLNNGIKKEVSLQTAINGLQQDIDDMQQVLSPHVEETVLERAGTLNNCYVRNDTIPTKLKYGASTIGSYTNNYQVDYYVVTAGEKLKLDFADHSGIPQSFLSAGFSTSLASDATVSCITDNGSYLSLKTAEGSHEVTVPSLEGDTIYLVITVFKDAVVESSGMSYSCKVKKRVLVIPDIADVEGLQSELDDLSGDVESLQDDVDGLKEALSQAISTTTIDNIVAGDYQPYREQTNRLLWAFKDHSTGDIVTVPLDSAPTTLGKTASPFYNKQTYDAEAIYAVPSLASCYYLNQTFFQQTNLREINLDGQDFSNVLNYESLFHACSALTSIDMSSSAKKGKRLATCFYGCAALTTLELGVWDMSEAFSVALFAKNCPALTTVTGTLSGIGAAFSADVSLDFSASTGLTRDSALVFINGLVSPNGHTATITFSAATYALLTSEDIAKITAAGWVNGNA